MVDKNMPSLVHLVQANDEICGIVEAAAKMVLASNPAGDNAFLVPLAPMKVLEQALERFVVGCRSRKNLR